MTYLAFKMDIVGSRKLHDRGGAQAALQAAVDRANERFMGALRAKFIVTHGDEVQGLFSAPDGLVASVEHFADALPELRLRFGIGRGALSTPLAEWAVGMDGQAWHRAKAAIEQVRLERAFIRFIGFAEEDDATLTALADLLLFVRSGWSEKQRTAIAALLDDAPRQTELARELGVSDAAVSKRLGSAGWRHYRDGRAALVALLVRSHAQPDA